MSEAQNVPMILYRQRHDLTQGQAGKISGVSQGDWSALERMHMHGHSPVVVHEIIANVAMLLDIDESKITPPEFKSREIRLSDLSSDDFESALVTRDEIADPVLRSHSTELESQLSVVLFTLKFREREIIKLRFGLAGGRTHTLDEIGKIFNITRERVRTIEAAAFRKLQHPVRAGRLEGFLSVYRKREEKLFASGRSSCPISIPVGQAIRQHLEEHRISQSEFAKEAGVSQSLISRLVLGTNSAGPTVLRLAKMLEKAPKRRTA